MRLLSRQSWNPLALLATARAEAHRLVELGAQLAHEDCGLAGGFEGELAVDGDGTARVAHRPADDVEHGKVQLVDTLGLTGERAELFQKLESGSISQAEGSG